MELITKYLNRASQHLFAFEDGGGYLKFIERNGRMYRLHINSSFILTEKCYINRAEFFIISERHKEYIPSYMLRNLYSYKKIRAVKHPIEMKKILKDI